MVTETLSGVPAFITKHSAAVDIKATRRPSSCDVVPSGPAANPELLEIKVIRRATPIANKKARFITIVISSDHQQVGAESQNMNPVFICSQLL
jgi:hypothetical protein